jgi:glycosyltransferase involved in cell wall biosynthesis
MGSTGGVTALRVAVLAPISWRTPPRHYGPWEQFASLLTEGLVERGADVTLFATSDSITSAHLVSVVAHAYSEDTDSEPKVSECLHIAEAFERAAEFDIIHNSFDFLPLTYSGLVNTPVITTIHGFSSPRILPVFRKYNTRTSYVAISDADRRPELDYIATIHHGIDTRTFTPRTCPGNYLLFFGRIHPDKGAVEAIDVAARSGLPLVMAGIIQDQSYFDARIAPHLDDQRVRYIGAVGGEDRNALLGGAYALLHLVNFEEPFGFSVVEAMACGTPVIASRRGSMPEIVSNGRTGFLVDNVEEAVLAVNRAAALDRHAVRQEAVTRFGRDRMIDAYLNVYGRVINGER